MRRTKIVCTIGPASRSPAILERLIEAGMDVARLNFSHGAHADHGEVVEAIRRISTAHGRPVAVLQDLSGPKIRIGPVAAGTVHIETGSVLTLTTRQVPGDAHEISVSHMGLPRDVAAGDMILLADGALELQVLETTAEDVRCGVQIGGPLSSHKGVNVPTSSLGIPSLTDKDKIDLAFGIQRGVDYVGLSFVRTAKDLLEAKRIVEEHGGTVPLVAKIEKHEAVENMGEIIDAADAVMVARGDLGVETPLEKGPLVQKRLIERSNLAGKPVITATQMLRSMVENPRPTRAEVTDVANAVLDGTDAVMLSEETAVGAYPVESVAMMARIAQDAESSPALTAPTKAAGSQPGSLGESVGHAACELAKHIDAAAIITFTQSGSTPMLVAKHRPRQLILAPTPLESTYRRLSLVWGVVPILSGAAKDTDEMITKALDESLRSGLVQHGQRVVITSGVPMGVPGSTNLIKVHAL